MIQPYPTHTYDRLFGTPGFSDVLLSHHFTLYQGYVKNTNTLFESLTKLAEQGKTGSPEFAELKRRFGWEFNGMRLHELYFANMAKTGTAPGQTAIEKALNEQFGSFDSWQNDFVGVGSMRGIGWVILYHDPVGGHFFNTWINEHDQGHLSGAVPLLVMDVFEHAYALDYGIKKADYIEAFLKAVDWDVVRNRFEGGKGC